MLLTAMGLALLSTAVTAPVQAETRAARGRTATPPRLIGKYDDWQAVTHAEAGQTVCYAFTRASSSVPTLPGRGDVVLTVTHRPGIRDNVAVSAGYAHRPGIRDNVAVSAGYAFPATAEMQLAVEGTVLPFYTANRSAFARDGHAATAVFARGRQAVARAPGPRGAMVTDTFPLRGFGPAYAAINRACPK